MIKSIFSRLPNSIHRMKDILLKRAMNYLRLSQPEIKGKEKNEEMIDEYMPSQIEVWRLIFKYLKLDWKIFIVINMRLVITTFIQIRSPFVMVEIKNALIEDKNNVVMDCIYEYIFYKIVSTLLNYIQQTANEMIYIKINNDIESSVIAHLFSLDISFFEQNKMTQLRSMLEEGISQITNELHSNQQLQSVSYYINMIGRLYFVYTISKQIAFSMFIISFLFALAESYLTTALSNLSTKSHSHHQFTKFSLNDLISNIHVIKTFGTEKKEVNHLRKLSQQNLQTEESIISMRTVQNVLSSTKLDVVTFAIIAQIYLYHSQPIMSNSSREIANSLTEIISVTHSMTFILNQILDLFKRDKDVNYDSSKIEIGKIIQLFNLKSSLTQTNQLQEEADLAANINKLKGSISFHNVTFKYSFSNDTLAKKNQLMHSNNKVDSLSQTFNDSKNDAIQISNPQQISSGIELQEQSATEGNDLKQYVLKDISFSIKCGQFVAFVGKSGSGKSTIIKLIQRFYDTTNGSISFDGQNIKDISLRRLKNSIGYVSQEPTLLDNDIEYNIAYGCLNDEYTQEEMKRACDISGVSEFIFDKKRFPDGLKTLIGANGAKLSGGQKQRVALARALIKNPSILLLDEATSSLDAESEYVVQKYIDELVSKGGMTIIVIAHRLSTVANSDVIFVVENGQIQEKGTHSQLLANNHIYTKLISRQLHLLQPQVSN